MIRPLSEALYDYRRVYGQDTNPTARENYKRYYLETCMFIGAESVYSRMAEGCGLDEAIEEWNKQGEKATPEKKEEERDYKARLDDVFVQNGKGYYRKRDDMLMLPRSVSKEKSEDKREMDRSRERAPRDSFHFVYDNQRHHEGNNYLYKRRSEGHSHRSRDRY